MSTKTKPMKGRPVLDIPAIECCEEVCLERPRYFSGQLLTHAELTTEQRYIIQRLRLHNRHLHGWGVVCGLEVTCHSDCREQVLIHPGHAIDCCGNDIVLCEETSFDVIGYLKERAKQVEPDCGPGAEKSTRDDCAGAGRHYYLVLSFAEEKARPVTALLRDDGCQVSRCQPSRIKETFRFDLIESSIRLPRKRRPTLLQRVCACIEQLATDEKLKSIIDKLRDARNYEEYYTLFCDFRDYLQDLYTKSRHNVRCNICDALSDIAKLPTQEEFEKDEAAYYPKLWEAFATLFGYLAQYLLDCICHGLLTPCPECDADDRVVLATISVKGDAITHVCNLARRWYPSPLSVQRQEREEFRGAFLPQVKNWLPKKREEEVLDDMLERLCCQMDLTTQFVGKAEEVENLDAFRKRLRATVENIGGLFQRLAEACQGARGDG